VLVFLVAVALIGLVMAGWSGYRLYHQLTRPIRETDVTRIEDWMTVGYIARAYRVPPDQLDRELGLSPQERGRQTLRQVAAGTGRPVEEVVAQTRQVVADLQAREPEPPPRWPGGVAPFGPGAPPKPRAEPNP
jgi:hypothetical protein